MLELFVTDKYDNSIAVTDGAKDYTFKELKELIASSINSLNYKKNNIVILNEDNFSFIIKFFALLFSNKNIFLITDKARLKDLPFDYDILTLQTNTNVKTPLEYQFPNIDINKPIINFLTSGSTGKPKVIKKTLYNLVCEAQDIGKELGFKGKHLYVMSTTNMCHLFGLTFHLMLPLCNGLIINTKAVDYPEDVDKENVILVSTPTFLSTVPKFDSGFAKSPKYIITAGSKLPDNIFKYFEKYSKIIEIYGSTETGIIAHKTHFDDNFVLFDNVDIIPHQKYTDITSNYCYDNQTTINDHVVLKNSTLKIMNRTDRLFKICEKRVSADELELKLKQNNLIKDCYITKCENKLVCLCALSKTGKDILLKENIPSLTKKLKQYLKTYSNIVPQKWKYIDEIPMTTTGKIDKNLIKHIFSVNLSLPVILDRTLDKNSIVYRIFFFRQCNFFNGHFPKYKIVPGVLQLYLAKVFAEKHFNIDITKGQRKRIKFKNIIKPDSIVNLKLEYDGKQISYEYYSDLKKYASGTFLCDNAFNGVL